MVSEIFEHPFRSFLVKQNQSRRVTFYVGEFLFISMVRGYGHKIVIIAI